MSSLVKCLFKFFAIVQLGYLRGRGGGIAFELLLYFGSIYGLQIFSPIP